MPIFRLLFTLDFQVILVCKIKLRYHITDGRIRCNVLSVSFSSDAKSSGDIDLLKDRRRIFQTILVSFD